MMNKRLVLVCALCLCLLAPQLAGAKDYGDRSKASVIWKTATLAPKGIGYSLLFEEILLPAIEKETEGDLYLKIYWGGVMGDDKQVLKKMHIGQIDGAGLSGQGTFMMHDDIPVLGLPFLFKSYKEVDYLKTRMIDTFDAIAMESGFKLLLWLDQDFDQIYSALPIEKVSDFPKIRFVTWFGALEGKLLEKMGARPVPLDVTEMPSTIRAGAVNGLIAPSIWIIATQLYNNLKYVNPMKIRYVPAFVVVTKKAWDAVPPKYITRIADMRLPLGQEFCDRSRIECDKALAALIKYGMEEEISTPAEMKQIKDRAIPLWNELAGNLYSQEILDEVLANLEIYREENSEDGGFEPKPIKVEAVKVKAADCPPDAKK